MLGLGDFSGVYQLTGVIGDQKVTVMLAFLEPSLGIICTCLVIMKPIGTRISSFVFGLKKSIESSVTRSMTTFQCNGIPTVPSEKHWISSKDQSEGGSACADPTVSSARILRFFAKPTGKATTKEGTTFQDTDIHIISHFSVSSEVSDLGSLEKGEFGDEKLARKALPALPPEAYGNLQR